MGAEASTDAQSHQAQGEGILSAPNHSDLEASTQTTRVSHNAHTSSPSPTSSSTTEQPRPSQNESQSANSDDTFQVDAQMSRQELDQLRRSLLEQHYGTTKTSSDRSPPVKDFKDMTPGEIENAVRRGSMQAPQYRTECEVRTADVYYALPWKDWRGVGVLGYTMRVAFKCWRSERGKEPSRDEYPLINPMATIMESKLEAETFDDAMAGITNKENPYFPYNKIEDMVRARWKDEYGPPPPRAEDFPADPTTEKTRAWSEKDIPVEDYPSKAEVRKSVPGWQHEDYWTAHNRSRNMPASTNPHPEGFTRRRPHSVDGEKSEA